MYSSLEHRSLLMMMGAGGAGGVGVGRGSVHPPSAPIMRPPMHFRPRFM